MASAVLASGETKMTVANKTSQKEIADNYAEAGREAKEKQLQEWDSFIASRLRRLLHSRDIAQCIEAAKVCQMAGLACLARSDGYPDSYAVSARRHFARRSAYLAMARSLVTSP
jgi:hypothetical protein